MNAPPTFRGVIPPVVTPLTTTGEVDVRSLERVVGHLLDAGVSGLFALGSTGETAYLTDGQRDQVLQTVVETTSGQVPVVGGCIETTTNRVIQRAELARKIGADAAAVTAPFYTRTHPVEIDRHYRLVRTAVDLPLIAYDIPVSVQVKLSPSLLTALAADGVIDGVKDSSGDDVAFRELAMAMRSHTGFSILTGHEVMVDAMMLSGADGAVPGLANVDPRGYVRLVSACQRDDWSTAREEQERLARLFSIVHAADPETASGSTAGIGAFKEALVQLGVIGCNATAPPMRSLAATEQEGVQRALAEAGLK